MGYRASLKVDMKKFRESMSEKTEFGENKVKFSSGGPDLPEPIGLKLVPIYEAFDVNFYTKMDHQQSSRCAHSRSLVGTRKIHVKKALHEYPRLKKAVKPFGTTTNQDKNYFKKNALHEMLVQYQIKHSYWLSQRSETI